MLINSGEITAENFKKLITSVINIYKHLLNTPLIKLFKKLGFEKLLLLWR